MFGIRFNHITTSWCYRTLFFTLVACVDLFMSQHWFLPFVSADTELTTYCITIQLSELYILNICSIHSFYLHKLLASGKEKNDIISVPFFA